MIRRDSAEWAAWVEEFSRGENAEAWRGIMCFLQWIQIRQENGHAVPAFLEGLEGDLFHSHLLRRLIAGKTGLKDPPPERHGLPWYDLLESGVGHADEARPWEWSPASRVAIDGGIWFVLEKRSDEEYIVTYRVGGEPFRLTPTADQRWLLQRQD